MALMEHLVDELQEMMRTLEPARLDGRDAARLTEVAAAGERLFATAKALLAKRAADTGAWRGGRAASVEQALADTSGCTEGSAREALITAARLESLPTTADRVRAGSLSIAQAAQVSAGAAVDPAAETRLPPPRAHRGYRIEVHADGTWDLLAPGHEADDRAPPAISEEGCAAA